MESNSGRFRKGERRSPQTEFQKGMHWRPHKIFREKEYLIQEYVEKKRSLSEIADEHGVTEEALLHWMKKHQIPRRTISQARAIKYWGLSGANNGMFGRTGEKNPNWKGGITPERQLLYVSPEWKRLVRAIKKRDHKTCQRCGGRGRDIHHMVPFEVVELRMEPTNLVLLCEPCHDFIHSNANVDKEFIRECPEGIRRKS